MLEPRVCRTYLVLAVAITAVVGCGGAEAEDEPADMVAEGEPLSPLDGCWRFEVADPAADGATEALAATPAVLQLYTDTTFPTAEGLLQVAAPSGSGGGMVSRISDAPDSIEITWAAASTSTHLRLGSHPDSLRGTSWHHGESAGDNSPVVPVRALRVACPGAASGG